jgi:hypothetical protein
MPLWSELAQGFAHEPFESHVGMERDAGERTFGATSVLRECTVIPARTLSHANVRRATLCSCQSGFVVADTLRFDLICAEPD